MASYLLSPVWLIFCLYYTKHRSVENGFNIKVAAIIFLPNVPAALLSICNFNGIFAYMIDGLVYYSYGFWIYMFIQFCYIALGNVFMIKYAITSTLIIRKRTAVIIVGYMLSILITILYYAFNIHFKMNNMDIVPSSLVLSLVFQVIALFKYRFLNVFPMALSDIIQNMNEGILIVDSENRIVFLNTIVSHIFKDFEKLHIGMDAIELSNYIRNNGKFNMEGKVVIDAISKGAFQSLSGEIELYNYFKLQLNYRPLYMDKELIGWVISFVDVGEYKALLNQLNEKNTKLSAAYSRLLEHAEVVEELAVLKERNRVAYEIHDSLGHSLSVLVALLEVCKLRFFNDTKSAQEKTIEAYNIAKSSLKELRMTVSNLSLVKYKGYNLVDALESLKTGFEATGINVDLTVKGNIPECLSEEYYKALYSICREALTNSLKHGEATVINIIMRFKDNIADLFIIDNGKGCSQLVRGMGLCGMENKVHKLKGKISFGSGEDKGFNIYVELPFK